MQTKNAVTCVTWPNQAELANLRAATKALGMPFSVFVRRAAAQLLQQTAADLRNPTIRKLAAKHRKLQAHS